MCYANCDCKPEPFKPTWPFKPQPSNRLATPERKTYRYRVTGDGLFFSPFTVEAETMSDAAAKASDILAGADSEGRRYYNTVETHVKSIVREDEVTR